jgi:hypothetical protein
VRSGNQILRAGYPEPITRYFAELPERGIEILRGVYPEHGIEILHCVQDDKRRAQDDNVRVQDDARRYLWLSLRTPVS